MRYSNDISEKDNMLIMKRYVTWTQWNKATYPCHILHQFFTDSYSATLDIALQLMKYIMPSLILEVKQEIDMIIT